MPLADALAGRGARRVGRGPVLPVGADEQRAGIKGHVHLHVAAVPGAVGRQPPAPSGLEHLVPDAADLEDRVDHLALLAHVPHVVDATAGQPHREPDVDRPLTGTYTDARVEPDIGVGIEAIEVVRLRPGAVTLDRVRPVV